MKRTRIKIHTHPNLEKKLGLSSIFRVVDSDVAHLFYLTRDIDKDHVVVSSEEFDKVIKEWGYYI